MDYVWMAAGLAFMGLEWLWDHRGAIEIGVLCLFAYFGGRSIEKYFAELKADVRDIKKRLERER